MPPALDGFSDVPNAVISHAGFALPETIDAGEPPLVHGTNDEVIILFELAEQTCAAAVAVGVVCELITHLNDHGFDGSFSTNHDTSVDAAIDFLNRHVLVPAGRAPLS